MKKELSTLKKSVFETIIFSLEEKLTTLQNDLEQYRIELSDNMKSTAGDKHETSRAMAQIEMEKLGKQHFETSKMLEMAKRIESNVSKETVQVGSLVKVNNMFYLLGISLGRITAENENIFCISVQSLVGKELLGKKIGDTTSLPNGKFVIVDIL